MIKKFINNANINFEHIENPDNYISQLEEKGDISKEGSEEKYCFKDQKKTYNKNDKCLFIHNVVINKQILNVIGNIVNECIKQETETEQEIK